LNTLWRFIVPFDFFVDRILLFFPMILPK